MILVSAVFPRVLQGGEDKIEVIQGIVSNIIRGFIITLTCHVVTLKSSKHVNYGYL